MSVKSTFSNSTSKSYAVALYELAKENSELSNVEDGMNGLKKLLDDNSDFKEMISNPTVEKEEKQKIMFGIADQYNFSQILKNFLGLITIKNRLFFLGKIINSFLNIISVDKGELIAKLISVLAPITKLRKKYRCRILIRCPKNLFIQKYLSLSLDKIKMTSGIKLEVDVDPVNFS